MSNLGKSCSKIIKNSAKIAASSASVTILNPFLDTPVIAGIWGNLLVQISKKSQHSLNKKLALKLATSVATGAAGYIAGSKVFTWVLNLIPGIGTLAYIGINGLLNYLFTYRFGKAVVTLMEKGKFDNADIATMASVLVATITGLPKADDFNQLLG